MKKYFGYVVAVGLIVAGCSDNDSAVPAPNAAPAPSAVGVQPADSVSSVVPPPVTAPAAPPPASPNQPSAAAAPTSSGPGLLQDVEPDYVHVLININNAYQDFRSSEMRSPRDFNELLSSGKLKEMPPAPAGKRYFIDEPNLRVILIKG